MGAFVAIAATLATLPTHAEFVTDPAHDFLGRGPPNGDMDALSAEVTFNPWTNTFTFTATVDGPIGTTAGGAWVWGLDRGAGVYFDAPAPFLGRRIGFDSLVLLFADQTGSFLDIVAGTGPQSLAPGSVKVSGNTITVTVSLGMLPSEGLAAQNYTWNFWPESALFDPRYISDLAPDARMATLTIVPEPSSLLATVAGLVALLMARKANKETANKQTANKQTMAA